MMAAVEWPCTTAFGHAGRVFGLAFHPADSSVLASASEDETVRVWARAGPSWQQTSCCRGHTSEVLRVAWSPDGALLASGSADHTVRLWQVDTAPQRSYAGVELAVLSGHPEEVYALHFLDLGSSSSSSSSASATAAAAQQGGSRHCNGGGAAAASGTGSDGSDDDGPAASEASSSADDEGAEQQRPPQAPRRGARSGFSSGGSGASSCGLLLTASGESLYLWDLARSCMLQQSSPLPSLRMSGLSMQQQQQQGRGARSRAAAAAPAGEGAVQQPDARGPDPGGTEAADEAQEAPPSYVFSVAVAHGTGWVAAACSDGMLRLWDASRRCLQEVAAVQVHPGELGSCCTFVPQQPLLVASLSKRGELVLQDLRLLGRPLLQQQLAGPAYDTTWVCSHCPAAQTAAAAGGASGSGGSGSDSGSATQLWLALVGRDSSVRCYPFGPAALQAGQLPEPRVLRMPSHYSGTLLAVTSTADGSTLAAAGEAVPAASLQQAGGALEPQQPPLPPSAPSLPPQQQQPQPQQHQAGTSGQPAARRGRARRRGAAVDLLSLADAGGEAADGSARATPGAAGAAPHAHGAAATSAGPLLQAPLFVLRG